MSSPEFYMTRAIELAKRGWGATPPNPMVGAVLVKNGEIIGEGWHTKDGAPHAEIECLKSATQSPEGADLYVTLEPCSTHGRTGACCDAIAAAKIARVFAGTSDPNPAHAGRAKAVLESRSIACKIGILEKQCRELNFIFNRTIVEQTAFVALKYAVSADGKITRRRGEHTQITGEAARADAMVWRRLFSAIGAGYGTLVSDNPKLTSRIEGTGDTCAVRLIFDAALRLADTENIGKFAVFSDKFAEKTRVVCASQSDPAREKLLAARGINVMRIDAPSDSPEFWEKLKKRLWRERIASLYIEGGAVLLNSCAKAKAADFAFEYTNPNLELGGGALRLWDGERPFRFAAPKKLGLGADTLEYGEIEYK